MNEKLELHIQDEGDFFYREAIKKLRANIQFSGKKNKIIMITSVFSGEGKSEVSFHLAQEMANAGKKVLYVDADIRKSVFRDQHDQCRRDTDYDMGSNAGFFKSVAPLKPHCSAYQEGNQQPDAEIHILHRSKLIKIVPPKCHIRSSPPNERHEARRNAPRLIVRY